MTPKDKDPITNKSGVIYRFKCSEDGCEEEYIGILQEPLQKGSKNSEVPLSHHDHCNISGHKADITLQHNWKGGPELLPGQLKRLCS